MNLTTLELDFILEMHIQDEPSAGTFVRAGTVKTLSAVEKTAAWERVLVGSAKKEMMSKLMPSTKVLERLRNEHRYSMPTIKMGPGSK